jgi:hypothetical protein
MPTLVTNNHHESRVTRGDVVPPLMAAMCLHSVLAPGAYDVSFSASMIVDIATPRSCRAMANSAVCALTSGWTPVPAYFDGRGVFGELPSSLLIFLTLNNFAKTITSHESPIIDS